MMMVAMTTMSFMTMTAMATNLLVCSIEKVDDKDGDDEYLEYCSSLF